MNKTFYTTRTVMETLDFKLLTNIAAIISSLTGEVDYLQVFHIKGNTMVHSQEVPEMRYEYTLSKKYEDCKIFAIRTDEEKKSYWTIMYAEEY